MTPKMENFCRAYLENGGNGAEAAKSAGYNGSAQTRAVRASHLLKRDDVKEFLAGHAKEACEKTQLTVEGVLEDLEKAKFWAQEGYATKEGVRKDLGAYLKACELQGKYLKMWIDKVEVSVSGHAKLMEVIKNRGGQ